MTAPSSVRVIVVLAALALARPATAQRQRLSMDPGWRFTLGDPAGAEQPGFDDRQWRTLDLPHDWSIEGTPREDAPAGGRGGYFPTGVGWYRKAFRLPPPPPRGRGGGGGGQGLPRAPHNHALKHHGP